MWKSHLNVHRVFFLFVLGLFGVLGDDLQEDLAKFDYNLNRKIKFVKYLVFFGLLT
jgi:hypothetical protein